MNRTMLEVSDADRRLLVAALLQYRSHLLGYVYSFALENGDEFAAEAAIMRDGHAERLSRYIRTTGVPVLTDGEE